MSVEIIQADHSDVAEVADLFDLYRQFYGQESNVDACRDYLVARQKGQESNVFYAKDLDGTVLGFTQIYPTYSSVSLQRDLVLNDLYVHESARGKGVARKLLQAAKDHALKVGSKGILLETDIINRTAQSLYEAFGFERETDHYFYYLKV